MPYITISKGITIKVPTRSTTGWDETLRTDTFNVISSHDHSGSGKGLQIPSAGIADDSITSAKILLTNDAYIRSVNAANSGNINLIKINASDEAEFGATVGIITIQDDGLSILDNADNTKIIALDASGITTGTTRTLSAPDASGVIVLNDNTATLTNKTLTGNIAVNLVSGAGTLTLPTATDTLVGRLSTDTLTNKSIDSDNNTITNIVDADIKAAAAIDATKIADGTVTSTEFQYINTLSSNAQTQINSKIEADSSDTLTNKSIDSDNNTITNIVNADIKAAAAIAVNKLAATTVSRALASDASGFITAATTTAAELEHVNGVTSAIQTQINSKLPTTLTTTGDIIYSSSGSTAARLGVGSNSDVLTLSGGIPSWAAPAAAVETLVTKTTTHTVLTSEDTILLDSSGGAFTVTTYTAVGNSGKKINFKKITSDTTAVTIDYNAAETADGASNKIIDIQWQTLTIQSDGTQWVVLNDYIPIVACRAYVSSNLTGITDQVIVFGTTTQDTHSGMNISTGVYTCQTAGTYEVSTNIYMSSLDGTTDASVMIRHESSAVAEGWSHRLAPNGASEVSGNPSDIIICAKGDTLDVWANGDASFNIGASSTRNYVTIKRIA